MAAGAKLRLSRRISEPSMVIIKSHLQRWNSFPTWTRRIANVSEYCFRPYLHYLAVILLNSIRRRATQWRKVRSRQETREIPCPRSIFVIETRTDLRKPRIGLSIFCLWLYTSNGGVVEVFLGCCGKFVPLAEQNKDSPDSKGIPITLEYEAWSSFTSLQSKVLLNCSRSWIVWV